MAGAGGGKGFGRGCPTNEPGSWVKFRTVLTKIVVVVVDFSIRMQTGVLF